MTTSETSETQRGGAALARCIACSAQTFSQEHWGRSPLLSRAAELSGDFSDLFSAAAVDELVAERGLRTPFLRMAKDGTVRAAAKFTRGGGAGAGIADQAADDRILSALADGSTLVLQGLHRTWPPLVELGARLADDLGHPVQINAYVTPPQNQGFAPHHDTHDVFVLQISGHKHWTAHRAVVSDPLDSQPFDGFKADIAERIAAEEPLIDTVLEPGDALYLPRGTVHSAQALGETSIHLTIGVHPLTRYALVRFLADAVVEDPELRASLPVGVDLADPAVLAPSLEATVAALRRALGEVDVAVIAERVSANLMARTRPAPVRPLAQLESAGALDLDTPLRRRDALRYRLVPVVEAGGSGSDRSGSDRSGSDRSGSDRSGSDRSGSEQTRLTFLDQTLDFPARMTAALACALGGEVVRPAELPELSDDDRLELAGRLLREGVLVPA